MHANTLLSPLADCPRCGGWARRVEQAPSRWHCRGCRWTGLRA
ncbi:MAG TPA: hypothetical protein VFH78_14905 [Candidatus Thermoplasmatota archaeon]|nr:hypothetical protein [Candidatus Thermoplasmatota archaeon]